jgi:hypothetical protein
MVAVFAALAALLYLISFILLWVGKGTVPFNYVGVFLLGCISLAYHLYRIYPWWPGRPTPGPPVA